MKIFMSILLLILERGTNVNVDAFAPLPSRNVHVFEGRQSFSQIGVVGTKSSSRTASSTTSVTKSSPSTLTQPVSPIDASISTSTNTNTNSNESTEISTSSSEYKRGLAIIGFITLMFSSNSPVLHAAFVNSENPPSVLLLNAATSSLALMGLVTFGPILNSVVPLPSSLKQNQKEEEQQKQKQQQRLEQKIEIGEKDQSSLSIPFLNDKMKGYLGAGVELGFWKTLGTTANLYGLSLTTANHGAFLIQLTTLIVPSIQGLMGVPVPKRIWTSIGLALSGIILFTQDMAGGGGSNMDALLTTNTMLLGDALCVVAAVFYATYDLRLFDYGKKVPPLPLIRTKIAVQALLSCTLLAVLGENDGFNEVATYVQQLMASTSSSNDLLLVGSAVAWSGLIINALVPFLQVSGQQTIGASRAQVVYASQPLWASMLSFVFLGEALGENGLIGGFLFLVAIFLAASAESPDADCGNDNCEV